jgi:hypothetical protein
MVAGNLSPSAVSLSKGQNLKATALIPELMERIVNKTGIMEKQPGKMTEPELRAWKADSFQRARQYLFSIGQPLVYYQKDGTPVAEYKDGRIEKLK